jgi:hypothetical protein
MDGPPAEPQWRVIHIPEGMVIDGAVAELRLYPDGIVAAEIRIPGPAVP